MADKTIGSLTQVSELADDSLFVCEDVGSARNVTGKQFKDFAQESVAPFVSAAEAAATKAEQAKNEAQAIVGGDFATTVYVDRKASAAEVNAKAYTDECISNISTMNVDQQISAHNTSDVAHADIRRLVDGKVNVSDIANDFDTNDANKVLSAERGAELKQLADKNAHDISVVQDWVAAAVGVAEDAVDKVNAHEKNKLNPHNVTAAQVGAPTIAEMNEAIAAASLGGGGSGGGVSSWNDLTDKPFGEESVGISDVLVPETSVVFSSKGQNFAGATEAAFNLTEGAEVWVTWNGEKYLCKCWKNFGYPALGNASLNDESAENTGEPFLITFLADGGVSAIKETSDDETITIKVGGSETVIRTIDKKFLPEHLQFGEETGVVEVLPEDTRGDIGSVTPGLNDAYSTPKLMVGQKYTVVVDGVEHECEAYDLLGSGTTALGDMETMTPFFIHEFIEVPATDDVPDLYMLNIFVNGAKNDGSHTVAIYENTTVIHPIATKYLPNHLQFGEETGVVTVEVLPETVVHETSVLDSGGMTSVGLLGLEEGKRYIVTVDGVEYEEEAWGVSNDTMSVVGLGSGSGIGFNSGSGGLEGGGIFCVLDVQSEWENGCMLGVSRSGVDESELIDRIVSITAEEEGIVIHPIEGKFLPKGTPWIEGEYAPLNIVFDGDMTGKETILLDENTYFVKVSDVVLSMDDLIGATGVIYGNGEELTGIIGTDVAATDMSEYGVPGIMVGDGGTPYMYAMQKDHSEDGITLTAGIWFICMLADGVPAAYSKSLSNPNVVVGNTTIHKLDPRCLPEITIKEVNSNIVNGDADGSVRAVTARMHEGDTYDMGRGAAAFGIETWVQGDASFACGENSKAIGNYSFAEGIGTDAYGEASHVQGKYNVGDTSCKYAHIVGNGTATTPSNAYTLDWDGNAWFAGDVYVGSTSGANKDDGSKKLATVSDVEAAIGDIGAILDSINGEVV